MNYMNVANGKVLFILCAIVISFVLIQSILFISKSWKRGLEIGLDKEKMKKAIVSSATFSIIPSLPILLILLMLMPTLGKFFPWLRLSVLGSGTYEYMAADMTATALGFKGMADPNVDVAAFVTVMWVMSLGILSGPIFNIIALKKYDSKLKDMSKSGGGFMALVPGAMLVGLLCVFLAPNLLNFKNPLSISTTIVSGISILGLGTLSKKLNNKTIQEFAFPVSMIIGMMSSILIGMAI
ncbi:MAG: DUF5058 family protein [Peptostreptococcaceae bacterium]